MGRHDRHDVTRNLASDRYYSNRESESDGARDAQRPADAVSHALGRSALDLFLYLTRVGLANGFNHRAPGASYVRDRISFQTPEICDSWVGGGGEEVALVLLIGLKFCSSLR